MCHTHTYRAHQCYTNWYLFLLLFLFLSSVVCLLCILLFSFINSRHTYRLLCWAIFFTVFAFRYEWNEVVSAHTGILIHFCPNSQIHWRIYSTYIPIFYSSLTHFLFLMNCSHNVCEWILKAPHNNGDRSVNIVQCTYIFLKSRIHTELMECICRKKRTFHFSMTNFRFSKPELYAHIVYSKHHCAESNHCNQYVVSYYDFTCNWMQTHSIKK